MLEADDPAQELNLTHAQRRIISRTALEFDRTGSWVRISTIAHEAAAQDIEITSVEIYSLPRRFGWITNGETIELSGLGLLFADDALATQEAMVQLVEVCVQRSVALRDEATISEAILREQYLANPFLTNRAEELLRKIPGLVGGGQGGDQWEYKIPWTALEYKHVHSVADLRLRFSMEAVAELRTLNHTTALRSVGVSPTGVGNVFASESIPNSGREGDDIWKPGMVRAFLSHLALHRAFASDVSRDLEQNGISGFVAHDHISVTHEWQAEIERALSSAEVFVGLVHPDSSASYWMQQEVGWAMGRSIPVFMVRLGADPIGFPAKYQWRSLSPDEPSAVATEITSWVSSLSEARADRNLDP